MDATDERQEKNFKQDLSTAAKRFHARHELDVHRGGEIVRGHLFDEIVLENPRAVHYTVDLSITLSDFPHYEADLFGIRHIALEVRCVYA